MTFANLKVGTRLSLGFGLVMALMAGLLGVGVVNMTAIEGRMEDIVKVNGYKTKLVNEMSDSIHIVVRVTHRILLLQVETAMIEERKKLDAAREKYNAAFAELKKLPASEKGHALRDKIQKLQDQGRPLTNKVVELAFAKNEADALETLVTQAAPAIQAWQDALHEAVLLQEEQTQAGHESASGAYRNALRFMFTLGGLALGAGLLIAWLLARSITRPLSEAVVVAETVAAGDLTSVINARSRDETGQLLDALKRMNAKLAEIVGGVRQGTEAISSASKQIAAGNSDLSQRTEEQASSLEETASSMEELTSTVKQNAENARQANQLAANASIVAVRGGEVAGQVAASMSSINESSKKIADITGVIDGIAFQTNILALNAAVEAARAGEHGRGFAVVASEVRTLAQRSAAAAKEIKALITDSVAKVEDGSKLVDQSGQAMEEIVTAVKRVTDIMAEIAAASQEQTAGIEQVNQAVTQMDQVTQQNAALVEEAAAAADSMQQQAQSLTQTVAIFKLSTTVGTVASSHEALATAGTEASVQMAPRSMKRTTNVTRLLTPASKPARQMKAAKVANSDENWREF